MSARTFADAFRRRLYRLPLLLRRIGFRGYERVLGIEWIVVRTRGRRTGRPHEVVVDVVGRDAAARTWYVSPANGRRSAWLRNALADPHVEVEAAGRSFAARARDASGEEGARVFLRFVREHPRYARLVARTGAFEDRSGQADDEALAYYRGLVVVALTEDRPAAPREPSLPARPR